MHKRVAVIDTGPSGITALKNLLDNGIDAIAFDCNSDGCIWPGPELQSKILAREIAGLWKRPINTVELCQKEV